MKKSIFIVAMLITMTIMAGCGEPPKKAEISMPTETILEETIIEETILEETILEENVITWGSDNVKRWRVPNGVSQK